MKPVIIDTNVFIAAAWNPRSSAAKILAAVRAGQLTLVWDDRTRAETQKLLTQIPRLRWDDVAGLFAAATRHDTRTAPSHFATTISDPDDRKFAALAHDTGATIITNDDDLLGTRSATGLTVLTPGQFAQDYL
jgi:predicted nucleic acid-binding protein